MTMNIPGYELTRLLGRGGMAEVYLARQTSLNREVAIKIIKDPRDPAFRERFQSEARTNASLSHPNIVTIHDFGSLEDNNYIVMELLKGGELRQRLARGMTLRQIVEAMRDVSSALAHAHRQGIVHRDVTSANVMFGGDGRAVLTDFGIAKLFGANSTKMTGTGLIIGTPDYMSPEQIRGETLDGRADIYSLGIVFWEALTGSTPFHSDSTITTCMRHLNETLPPLPRLVGPVGDVVFRMLAKQPAERYQTADELGCRSRHRAGTLAGRFRRRAGYRAVASPTAQRKQRVRFRAHGHFAAAVLESGGAPIRRAPDFGVHRRAPLVAPRAVHCGRFSVAAGQHRRGRLVVSRRAQGAAVRGLVR